MNRRSCRTSKRGWSKNCMLKRLREGALIWATKSSKYPQTPRNARKVRDERRAHIGGGDHWSGRPGEGVGEENVIISHVSLGNADRLVSSTSGDMYPGLGISVRWRERRSLAARRSVGSAGNGMPCKMRYCRRGADLPKNVSGRTCTVSSVPSSDRSSRNVNAGNGSCI